MKNKLILSMVFGFVVTVVTSSFVAAGQIEEKTISGRDRLIHSPLRQGDRTEKIPFPGKMKSIEVKWMTKKNSEQEAHGWLFLNGVEYDWARDIMDIWRYDQWDNVLDGYPDFQLGITDDGEEVEVHIDWIRLTYEKN